MSELDAALARFQQGELEYLGGLSNHGPMVAETLEALGHESLIPAWVDIYAARLGQAERGESIAPEDRDAQLGSGRDADWVATFATLLEEAHWSRVVGEWVPRLAPGLFAAAAHGLIRTAHALRALEASETPIRVKELAIGLGYWASRYQPLPGEPGALPRAGCGPADVLRTLPLLDASRRRPGFFTDAVRPLADVPDFADALAEFDVAALSFTDALSELCATAAGLYLDHPDARIAYAHCVTGPSALRLLAPHIDEASRSIGLGYALQVVAALHTTHGHARLEQEAPARDAALVTLSESSAEMRYRAACSLEEHAIKLTEACLREDAIRPDVRLRLAAADAATQIGASRGGRGG